MYEKFVSCCVFSTPKTNNVCVLFCVCSYVYYIVVLTFSLLRGGSIEFVDLQ